MEAKPEYSINRGSGPSLKLLSLALCPSLICALRCFCSVPLLERIGGAAEDTNSSSLGGGGSPYGLTTAVLVAWQIALMSLLLTLIVHRTSPVEMAADRESNAGRRRVREVGGDAKAVASASFLHMCGAVYICWQLCFSPRAIASLHGGAETAMTSPRNAHELLFWSSVLAYLVFVELLATRYMSRLLSLVKRVEGLHNAGLSLLSLAMLVGICRSVASSGKHHSVHTFICKRFNEDDVFVWTAWAFFYSKYWEWVDTALLVAKGKKVTWLHYTHHASTAFLTGLNMTPQYNAVWSVVCITNSFVHFWMYGYYAQPALLRWSRKFLTKAQILQHMSVLGSSVYITALAAVAAVSERGWLGGKGEGRIGWYGEEECYNHLPPILVGVGLYLMYLLFFLVFYKAKYADPSGKKVS